ncbi:AzlD domain-containing protein [Brevibacillus marinus]|uniref:AzlD domain-containing protein n=1 Tax=Brevibacillus marinus TaxID=2496837 RepID=UPI000F825C1B|nr:AzlD domain-containing protein [Brevibacillus marinus]
MTAGETLLLYLAMAAVTYLSRRVFLRLPGRYFSARLKSGLSFIPVGIFAALIFPSLFLVDGRFVSQPLYLAASVLCLVLMAISRNVFVSFGISLLLVVLVSIDLLPVPW